jgi:hypothetical protein
MTDWVMKKVWKGPMKDLLTIVLFVGAWILLQRVILPRLGIGT